jgi:hypothetical protein
MIDAKKDEDAKKREKPLEINEWGNADKKSSTHNNAGDISDPSTIAVKGDIQMNMDVDKAIEEDINKMAQEAAEDESS